MWKADKRLFALIAIYITGLAWFALRQHEEFPFLLYGMYSLKEKPQDTYIAYAIKVDGKEVRYTTLWDLQKEMIVSPLTHAIPLYESGKISEHEMKQLYAWLFRYMADMRMVEDNTMTIEKLTCRYAPNGSAEVINRETVINYVAE